MDILDALKQMPQELVTLAVGTIGGLVGFLVSEGKTLSLGISAIIVGGFSAFIFTPLIIAVVELYGKIVIVDDVKISITGSIAAVSWQLVISLKAILPTLIAKLTKTKGMQDDNRK